MVIIQEMHANEEHGTLVCRIMFHSSIISGEAVINITLNATSLAHGRLLLYHREDWHDAVDDDDCIRRIGKARMVCE